MNYFQGEGVQFNQGGRVGGAWPPTARGMEHLCCPKTNTGHESALWNRDGNGTNPTGMAKSVKSLEVGEDLVCERKGPHLSAWAFRQDPLGRSTHQPLAALKAADLAVVWQNFGCAVYLWTCAQFGLCGHSGGGYFMWSGDCPPSRGYYVRIFPPPLWAGKFPSKKWRVPYSVGRIEKNSIGDKLYLGYIIYEFNPWSRMWE